MDLVSILEGLFGASGAPLPSPPGTKQEKYGDPYSDGANIDALDLESLLRPQLAATTVPTAQQPAQAWENAKEVLSIVPGIGHAMSAKDAQEGYNTTVDEWEGNSNKRNALNLGVTGLSALGAVTGLPFSKTAGKVAKRGKDTASVFFPATDDAPTDLAKEMRQEGKPGHVVHRETGRTVSPEGEIYEELPDLGLKVNPASGGSKMRLDQAIEHPQLFDMFPEFREQKVRYGFDVDPTKSNKNLHAQTTPEGDFLVPVGAKPSDFAKLLQYRMNTEFNLPRATRHSITNTREDFAKSADNASRSLLLAPDDIKPLAKYTERMDGIRGFLGREDINPNNRSRGAGEISSGNITARRVQQRADMDPMELALTYPFGGRPNAPSSFQNLLPLVPDNLTPAQTREWLNRWGSLGSGAETQGASLEELLEKMMKR